MAKMTKKNSKLKLPPAHDWRKHQTKPVTVINLISENTIEHRMLETLAMKQTVATSVLDKPGEATRRGPPCSTRFMRSAEHLRWNAACPNQRK